MDYVFIRMIQDAWISCLLPFILYLKSKLFKLIIDTMIFSAKIKNPRLKPGMQYCFIKVNSYLWKFSFKITLKVKNKPKPNYSTISFRK